VEKTFRTAKHLLSTRPIFQKLDRHLLPPVLQLPRAGALVLKKALEDRIAAPGHSHSSPEIIADLDSLTETEIEHEGKHFVVRSHRVLPPARPVCSRRCVAANRPRRRGPLTPPNRKCSAKAAGAA
jgi:hypothetical protein